MLNDTQLHTVLQDHLHWNRARISFIVAFVLALMKVTTVNLTKVANALGGTALRPFRENKYPIANWGWSTMRTNDCNRTNGLSYRAIASR